MKKKFRSFLSKWYRLILRIRGLWVRIFILALGGKCGAGLLVDRGFNFKYPPHPGIQIGRNVSFGPFTSIDCPEDGTIIIRDRAAFTRGALLAAAEYLEIGEDVLVGEYGSLRDSDHGIDIDELISRQKIISVPVIIEHNVWIGRGVAVLKGVRIGSGAVIGANAVVKTDIPPNAIAVGVPARIIRMR